MPFLSQVQPWKIFSDREQTWTKKKVLYLQDSRRDAEQQKFWMALYPTPISFIAYSFNLLSFQNYEAQLISQMLRPLPFLLLKTT